MRKFIQPSACDWNDNLSRIIGKEQNIGEDLLGHNYDKKIGCDTVMIKKKEKDV